MNGARGFTLLELLLALTIAAMLAVSAIATLDLLVETDARAGRRSAVAVDVARALALLQRDVQGATGVDVQSGQWTLSYDDGSAVVYAVPPGTGALHRIRTLNLLATLAALPTLLLGVTPATYGARGHQRDSTYQPDAVFQGAAAIRAAFVRSPRNNRPIGVLVAVDHAGAGGLATTSCAALSLPLAELHCKP